MYLLVCGVEKEKKMRQLNEIQDVSKVGSHFNIYNIFLSLPRQACLVPCTTTERKDVEKYADGIL